MRSKICLICLVAILLLQAGAQDNRSTQSKYVYATIQSSCAPWDGSAIAMTLATKPLQCKRAPEGPFLTMGVWKDLPLHAGQVVKIERGTSNGFASRCSKENECEAVESAEITFETYKEGQGATGHYELHFKNGDEGVLWVADTVAR
jgi:hypothetical protein